MANQYPSEGRRHSSPENSFNSSTFSVPPNRLRRLSHLQASPAVNTPDTIITPLTDVLHQMGIFSNSPKLQDYEEMRLAKARELGLGDSPTKPAYASGTAPGPASGPHTPASLPGVRAFPSTIGGGQYSFSPECYPGCFPPSSSPAQQQQQQPRPLPSSHSLFPETTAAHQDFFGCFKNNNNNFNAAAMDTAPSNPHAGGHRGTPSHPTTGPATFLRPGTAPLPPTRQPVGPGLASANFSRRPGVPLTTAASPASYIPPAARTIPAHDRNRHLAESLLAGSTDPFIRSLRPSVLAETSAPASPSRLSASWRTAMPAYPRPPSWDTEKHFRPMEARRVDNKSNGGSDISAALEKMTKGFSPFYKGDTDILRNRSAEIPAEENCSLFITGLSPTTTTPQLLGAIRNVGRVYATHINGPEPDRGHMTCAAKVVFFERAAAERFYARFHTGFHIPAHPNHTGRVVWNRIRSAEVDPNGRKSRVLLISGPKALVNETALRAYLSTKIQYQVEAVIPLHHATVVGSKSAALLGLGIRGEKTLEQRALIEFRFGSYRCQAEAARMALAREFKEYGVFCEFGRDPCDLESRRQFW